MSSYRFSTYDIIIYLPHTSTHTQCCPNLCLYMHLWNLHHMTHHLHACMCMYISRWSPIAGANQAFFTQGLVDDVASGDPWLTRVSLRIIQNIWIYRCLVCCVMTLQMLEWFLMFQVLKLYTEVVIENIFLSEKSSMKLSEFMNKIHPPWLTCN